MSVYRQLADAVDAAAAAVADAVASGADDDSVLRLARQLAVAKGRWDGAVAIIREMEDDADEFTLPSAGPAAQATTTTATWYTGQTTRSRAGDCQEVA